MKTPKIPASVDKFRATGRSGRARSTERSVLGVSGALLLCLGGVQACSSSSPDTNTPAASAGQAGTATTGGASGTTSGVSGGPSSGGGGASSAVGGGGASSAIGGGGAGGTSGSAGAAGSAGAGGSAGGSAGAAGSGGGASCVTSGSELCDDFESGKLDATRWKQNTSSNMTSITVETGHAHTGQYAVHLKFVAGAQNTVTIEEGVTFPATPNKFYSRMWAYFSPDIPKATNMDFHTGFMMGGGKNGLGDTTLGMGMIGSDQQYLGYSIFFGNPKFEFGPWSNTRIQPNQWLCIELFEDGTDPTTEKRQVWLNDTELTDIASDAAKAAGGNAANSNHLPPKFDKVTFGVTEYHPIPTLTDMWIDDVRVSSQKIGCTK